MDLPLKNIFSCIFHSRPYDQFFIFAKSGVNKTRALNNCEMDSFLRAIFFFSLSGYGEGKKGCGGQSLVPGVGDELSYVCYQDTRTLALR